MKAHVLTDFSNWRDADLDYRAQLIAGAMKDNPHFPMLADKAAAVGNSADAFHGALLSAARGNGEAHSIKDNMRAALLKALRALGVNINLEADGDRALLESTGYPVSAATAAVRKAKPDLQLTAGTGAISGTLRKVPGAGSYMVQYTPAPVTEDSHWATYYAVHTSFEITGLKADTKYAIRVAPVFHGQEPVYSPIVYSKYVE